MSSPSSYVIIGNGIAGVTAAEALRDADKTATITIIADEPFPVYYRPALKDYLAEKLSEAQLWARPNSFYKEQRIRFIPERVIGVDPAQHLVVTHTRRSVSYQKLLLAQGARARQLDCPGSDLQGVITLRTVTDYQKVMQRLPAARQIVICGGGPLALESAEVLHQAGHHVTHILRYARVWSEVLDRTASDLLLQEAVYKGVEVYQEAEIAEIVGTSSGQITEVSLTNGERIPCDMVLVAIGIEPVLDCIKGSGIAYERGITVSAGMCTSVPDIYAAGDVIEMQDPFTGRLRLLGQWYPAIQQAQVAASSMLGLSPPGLDPLSLLYSATRLYRLDILAIGLTQEEPFHQIVLAEPQLRYYRKVILQDGIAVGALLVGERGNALAFKRAIDHGVNLLPVVDQLFSRDFDLESWLDRQQVPQPLLGVRGSAMALPQMSDAAPWLHSVEHRPDLHPFSRDRVAFEIDMCIGCNRCMAACPVPLSASVSIADLNAATISPALASHVARFTYECIMCGSCVPVCPVDNHRDLLMLSLKQRVGNPWEAEPDLDRIGKQLPAHWDISLLLQHLRENTLLADLPHHYLLHLAAASQIVLLKAGEIAMREGEFGREISFVLQGRFALFVTGADGNELLTAYIQPRECLGEYGMLTGQPHYATAWAQFDSVILQVPEQVMRHLMELVPQVRHAIEQANNAHSVDIILQQMTLFQGVSQSDIRYLAEHAQIRWYERNECLFSERIHGQRPARETVHLILEGMLKVTREVQGESKSALVQECVLAYRQGGDYFVGGLNLAGDGRPVTTTAITRVRVAEIPRQVVMALFQRYPEVNQRFLLRLKYYVETAPGQREDVYELMQVLPAEEKAVDLHSLIHGGVIEGTEVLVIDLNKCIHCNECEEACARRHGQSRMNRAGMHMGNLSVVTACRHCQDPVCMLCSRAGIARLPSGEVYITESCIGCGICAERCPYGAISITDLEEEAAASPSSWRRFRRLFTGEKHPQRAPLPMFQSRVAPGPLDRQEPWNAVDEMRKKIAVKCDLCAGYTDQACVTACPVGAAFRIQPSLLFSEAPE